MYNRFNYVFSIVTLGLSNDINIVHRTEGVATNWKFKLENMNNIDNYSSAIPRHKTNVLIGVVDKVDNNILDLSEEQHENISSKTSLYWEAKAIISDDSDDEDPEVCGNKTLTPVESTYNNVLELFSPSSDYWCIHIHMSKNMMSNDDFDLFAMKYFPSTFLWLLKECSRMIHIPMRIVYKHVVSIEIKMNEELYLKRLERKYTH